MLIALLFIGGLIGLYVLVYNGLMTAQTRVEQGWSGIEVQLHRRHDLVPVLVKAVRTALGHESRLFERIAHARQTAVGTVQTHDAAAISAAEGELGLMTRGLLALIEDNPEITATGNVETLQRQLEETEDQIAAARRLYNGNVQDLNGRIARFPGNVIARLHGITPARPFQIVDAERAMVYSSPTIEFA